MHVNGGCADPMSANLFIPLPNDWFATAIGLTGPERLGHGGNNGATKEAGEPAVAGQPRRRLGLVLVPGPGHRQAAPLDRGVDVQHPAGRLPRLARSAALHEVACNDNVNPTLG